VRHALVALGVVLLLGATACGARDEQASEEKSRRFVLQSNPNVSSEEIDGVISVMRKRLDDLGAENAKVEREGDRIVVTLPTARIDFELVKKPGRLELFDLQGSLVPGVSLDDQGNPRPSRKPLEPRPNTVVLTCGAAVPYCPGVGSEPTRTYYYLIRNEPKMTGDDIERKGTRQDFDTGPGRGNEPVVTMQFTDSGAVKFEEVTRTLAERGRQRANTLGITDRTENDVANQQFAIVFDGEIKSAPTIDFDDNPAGIPGDNGAIITGISLSEAKALALILRSGSIPTLQVVSEEETGK
jgi:preprotein translocase subunit SecD